MAIISSFFTKFLQISYMNSGWLALNVVIIDENQHYNDGFEVSSRNILPWYWFLDRDSVSYSIRVVGFHRCNRGMMYSSRCLLMLCLRRENGWSVIWSVCSLKRLKEHAQANGVGVPDKFTERFRKHPKLPAPSSSPSCEGSLEILRRICRNLMGEMTRIWFIFTFRKEKKAPGSKWPMKKE